MFRDDRHACGRVLASLWLSNSPVWSMPHGKTGEARRLQDKVIESAGADVITARFGAGNGEVEPAHARGSEPDGTPAREGQFAPP